MKKQQISKVSVIAPARLHMGFMDLSGSLGRHFGSIGVALNEINTHLSMGHADKLILSGYTPKRTLKTLHHFCKILNVADSLHLDFKSTIPEHVGLGSGTQLALAIGSGLNAFYDLGLSVRDIAKLSERGARSGIGIGVFENGGLVVDGGRGKNTETPPILCQMTIPETWRFILVFDERGQGLHGQQEINAFKKLPTFPQQEAARLCHLLLMQGLPAVAEKNMLEFGEVITQLQQSVGEHFAAAQGGIFTSKNVAKAMAYLQQQGAVAIGQTSWGPTGFCMVKNKTMAQRLVAELETQTADSKLCFQIVQAKNSGAEINIDSF